MVSQPSASVKLTNQEDEEEKVENKSSQALFKSIAFKITQTRTNKSIKPELIKENVINRNAAKNSTTQGGTSSYGLENASTNLSLEPFRQSSRETTGSISISNLTLDRKFNS